MLFAKLIHLFPTFFKIILFCAVKMIYQTRFWVILVTTAITIRRTVGKCQDPDSYPIMTPGNFQKYLCMVTFQEPRHQMPFLSCNGNMNNLHEGFSKSGEATNETYSFPSAVIKSGCNFTMFKEYGFKGNMKEFAGPAVLPEVPGLIPNGNRNQPDGFKSYLCGCEMSYLDCIPRDKFDVILYCDATTATANATCKYTKAVGTSLSKSLSKTTSIGLELEKNLKATLFSMFDLNVGGSLSTGFSWGDASDDVKSQTVSVEVSATVPPGTILKIEQAIGICGDSVIRTPMFKFSHVNGTTKLP